MSILSMPDIVCLVYTQKLSSAWAVVGLYGMLGFKLWNFIKVAQLVRAWQAISQVVGSSPSLSYCQFLFRSFFLIIFFFLTDFDIG